MVRIVLLIILFPLGVKCQNNGIHWTTGISMDGIKAKAKAERKYIFLDCFATWCVPCKEMDKSTYISDTVGDFFNQKFISVKVQTDKTAKDDSETKAWYASSDLITKQYKVFAYPTMIFISPDGEIVYKDQGFKTVSSLLKIAKEALMPGRVYINPYAAYEQFIDEHKKGKRNYAKYPLMIETAAKIGDATFYSQLLDEFYHYLNRLGKHRLYTPRILSFLTKTINSSSDQFFDIFYLHGNRINKVMKSYGYAETLVKKVIIAEQIAPVIKRFVAETSLKAMHSGIDINWDSLENNIARRYNLTLAKVAVLTQRVEFYWRSRQFDSVFRYIEPWYNAQKRISFSDSATNIWLNVYASEIFTYSRDEHLLEMARNMVEDVLRLNVFPKFTCFPLDTYGNIIYKLSILHNVGSVENAIEWEEKALENAIQVQSMTIEKVRKTIGKMKGRLPTWP
jgi:thioredoxin-related protein